MNDRTVKRIRRILEETYVHDLYVIQDSSLLSQTFHSSFRMLRPSLDGRTGLIRDAVWTDPREEPPRHPKAIEPDTTFDFPMIDVTGDAALAKVIVRQRGEPVFTDYVLLYLIDGTWRIVGKVFHAHLPLTAD